MTTQPTPPDDDWSFGPQVPPVISYAFAGFVTAYAVLAIGTDLRDAFSGSPPPCAFFSVSRPICR